MHLRKVGRHHTCGCGDEQERQMQEMLFTMRGNAAGVPHALAEGGHQVLQVLMQRVFSQHKQGAQ